MRYLFVCLLIFRGLAPSSYAAAPETESRLRRADEALGRAEYDKAEQLALDVLKVHPTSIPAALIRARARALGREPETALPLLSALAADPQLTGATRLEVLWLLGRTALRKEKTDLAGRAYAEAAAVAEMLPDDLLAERVVHETLAVSEWSRWRRREFEDFVLFYPPQSPVADDILRYKARLASQLKLLNDTFGVKLTGKVDLFIYNGAEHRREVFSAPDLWLSPQLWTGHVLVEEGAGEVFLAVLTHVGGKGALPPKCPFLVEGMASQKTPKDRQTLEQLGRLALEEKLPRLEDLAAITRVTPEARQAGRIFGHMLEERFGRARFLALWYGYNDGPKPFQRLLGVELGSLQSEFQKHVMRVYPGRSRLALLNIRVADIVYRLGYLDLAIERLRQALIFAPDAVAERCNLAILYERTGDLEGAVREFRRARKDTKKTEALDKKIVSLEKRMADGRKVSDSWWPVTRWRSSVCTGRSVAAPALGQQGLPSPRIIGEVVCVALPASAEVVGLNLEDGQELWRRAAPQPVKPDRPTKYRYVNRIRAIRRAGERLAVFVDRWEYIRGRPQRTSLLVGAQVMLLDARKGSNPKVMDLPAPLSQAPSEIVDGRVVYGLRERRSHSVRAVDLATGKALWESGLRWQSGRPPLLTENRALWLTGNREIVALEAVSGKALWRAPVQAGVVDWRVDDRGRLFVAGYDRSLRVLRVADGKQVAAAELDGIPGRGFAVFGNQVFLADASTGRGYGLDLDRSGTVWERRLPKAASREAVAVGEDVAFVSGLRDYYVDERPRVLLIRRDGGTIRWDEAISPRSSYGACAQGVVVASEILAREGDLLCTFLSRLPGPPPKAVRARTLLQTAKQHLANKHFEMAEALLEHSLRFDPLNAESLIAYADALSERGNHKKAVETIEKLVEHHPAERAKLKGRLRRLRRLAGLPEPAPPEGEAPPDR